MAGAIVIAGSDPQVSKDGIGVKGLPASDGWDEWHSCVASVPVLGHSSIARTAESMKRAGLTGISILGTSGWSENADPISSEEQAWLVAIDELKAGKENNLDAVVITRTGHYIECEWRALLEQHRKHGEAVSRAFDIKGPLDLWVVDPNRFCADGDLLTTLRTTKTADCAVEGYVNRLTGMRDLRRLATDILSFRCRVRPLATEVRPGLWLADGAQVARNARVVAPAYIGHRVKICDDCVITRCSAVETNSYVDFGTAIEDSSVLPDTYVGIVGAAWPGFNDSAAKWGLNRHMDSRCGQTFEDTLHLYTRYFDASHPLPFVMIETWNDYEEGTAVERLNVAKCTSSAQRVAASR